MILLKILLRLLLLIGLLTIVPLMFWWIFTGLGFHDTLQEIECMD